MKKSYPNRGFGSPNFDRNRLREIASQGGTLKPAEAKLLALVSDMATTMMSDKLADPIKLMDATGHTDMKTTLKYRHKRPRHQKPVVEQLSRDLPIEDLVTAPRRRAVRLKRAG